MPGAHVEAGAWGAAVGGGGWLRGGRGLHLGGGRLCLGRRVQGRSTLGCSRTSYPPGVSAGACRRAGRTDSGAWSALCRCARRLPACAPARTLGGLGFGRGPDQRRGPGRGMPEVDRHALRADGQSSPLGFATGRDAMHCLAPRRLGCGCGPTLGATGASAVGGGPAPAGLGGGVPESCWDEVDRRAQVLRADQSVGDRP